MKFSIKDFFSKCDQTAVMISGEIELNADLGTFTE